MHIEQKSTVTELTLDEMSYASISLSSSLDEFKSCPSAELLFMALYKTVVTLRSSLTA